MKFASLVVPVLVSAFSISTALAAVPKGPARAPTESWYILEALACAQGGRQLTFETYTRENIVTYETIDRINVGGTGFRETHRAWRENEILAEEIYIRSANGAWMFYSPIEGAGIHKAMSRNWKKAGIDEKGDLICSTETVD
jgi:hypothetical protein